MKTKYIKKITMWFSTFTLFLITGCATIEETIYLGDVDVSAPLCPPPTHVSINKDVGDVTFSPRFAVNTSESVINCSTDDRYSRTLNYDNEGQYLAKQKNLTWHTSDFTVGVDMDFKILQNFSIFAGVNYSEAGNTGLMGGTIGIGLHNHAYSPSFRLDLGLTVQEYNYTAISIVKTKISSIFSNHVDTRIYSDKGSSTNINPFGAITINSTNESSLFNWFFSVGFFTQNLLGFKPGTKTDFSRKFKFPVIYTKVDNRSDIFTGFLLLNPGVSISIDPQIKILISAKINREILTIDTNKWYVLTAVKFDFQL